MSSWRALILVLILIGLSGLGLFMGCTRQINVPVSPSFANTTLTFTSTPSSSPTNTATTTGTSSPTNTATLTTTQTSTNTATNSPTGNLPTATNTATNTVTSSPTNTATVTDTLTATNSPTNTMTNTPTNTPTPNYALIDDFQGTGGAGSDSVTNIYQVTDQNGVMRNGYWYAASDGGTVISSGTGYIDPTAIEDTVTFSTYSQLAFSFTNPAAPYDATVGGRYNGISFWGKLNSLPSTICGGSVPFWVDFVDNNGAAPDHSVGVAFTTSWQQFTVYFNQAGWDGSEDANSVSLNYNSIINVKFEPQNHGVNNFNVDFLVDDIQLINGAAPAAPGPPPANLVNDFEDGGNRAIVYNGSPFYAGTASGRNGYWFTYQDSAPDMICPLGTFFPDAPGYNSSFAFHMSAVTCVAYAGGGMNFNQTGGTVNAYNGSGFTGITFYVKSSHSNSYGVALGDDYTEKPNGTGNCGTAGYPSCSADATDYTSATTSWTLVTIPYTSFGSPGYGWTGLTVTPPDTANLYQIKFQIGGGTGAFDLWVDNLSFY